MKTAATAVVVVASLLGVTSASAQKVVAPDRDVAMCETLASATVVLDLADGADMPPDCFVALANGWHGVLLQDLRDLDMHVLQIAVALVGGGHQDVWVHTGDAPFVGQ
jgi:hypothetical protein